MSTKILIVDDEKPIVDLLAYNLKRANYAVVIAHDGQAALDLAQREKPDLIILDIMLPQVDGLEVCRVLRRASEVPIIMLTALDSELDKVVGLEMGADDYVSKPFSVRELLARVKNILRRAGSTPSLNSAELIRRNNLTIDIRSRETQLDGNPLTLTALEFDLLHTLAVHSGQVLTRERLLELVWGYDYFGDVRVVDAVVKRLRLKLSHVVPQNDLIATVRGVGYKFST